MSDSSALDQRSSALPESGNGSSSRRAKWIDLAQRALIAAPDRIISSFLVSAIPVGLAVIFHVFVPAVVLPAAVVLVVALWRWTPSSFLTFGSRRSWWDPRRSTTTTPEPGRFGLAARAAVGAAVALLVVVVWLWVNRQHLSAYVVLTRDPGIYTLRGMWLTNHATPLISSTREAIDAGGLQGANLSVPSFQNVGSTLYPQANALLPGLLGVVGWFLKERGVLVGNLLIGSLAILSVYAFARRLMGPLLALVPMVALAASMPMVAFSRGPYSEPVALVSTFGGLTLLWIAWQSGRIGQFFAAGLLIGVGSLSRIDGGVTLIGVLAGFAVVTLAARSRAIRVRAALACSAWALGAAILDAASLYDGKVNSPVYQASEWHGIKPLLIVGILAYLFTVGVAFLPVDRLRQAVGRTASGWAKWTLIAALALGVLMATRPLWWVSHSQQIALQPALAAMQGGLRLPVDGSRSYSESSVSWMAMYLSWPVVILAAIGAALLLARLVSRRDPRLAVFVLTVASVSVLYLNQISIFPDQIWAMRRFLPVVFPGLIIAAVYPIVVLVRNARLARFRPRLRVVGVVLALVVVASPIVVWVKSGLWGVSNGQAQIAEVNTACAVVGTHPVVLAGPDPTPASFLPTFKAACDSEVFSYNKSTTAGLAKLEANFTNPAFGPDTSAPVVVVFDAKSVAWESGTAPAPYITTTLTAWAQPLGKVPAAATRTTRSIWFATIAADGKLVPITGGATIVNGP